MSRPRKYRPVSLQIREEDLRKVDDHCYLRASEASIQTLDDHLEDDEWEDVEDANARLYRIRPKGVLWIWQSEIVSGED